jgi:hypothetical protein
MTRFAMKMNLPGTYLLSSSLLRHVTGGTGQISGGTTESNGGGMGDPLPPSLPEMPDDMTTSLKSYPNI